MDERETLKSQGSAPNRGSDFLNAIGYLVLLVVIFFVAILTWAVFEIVTGIQLVGGPDDN